MSDPTSQATIDSVLREDRVFPPPEAFARHALVSGRDAYDALYRRSIDDPEGFWSEMARASCAGSTCGPRCSTGSRRSPGGSSGAP